MLLFKYALLIILGTALASDDNFQINQEFLDGYNGFVGNVFNQLRQSNPGNFLVSPLSVQILLALLENASEGETSKELIRGLQLPEDKEIVNEAFSLLTPKLNVDAKYTLTSANKIYVKKGKQLIETFKQLAVDVYDAEIEDINFSAKQEAANQMNNWVAKKTHNKINNLIEKDSLDDYTRVVLLNALYFHGNWVTKFDKSHTRKDKFYLGNVGKTEVELMEIVHDYNYYESAALDAKFLELPYAGKDVTLTIVLPNAKDGIQSLEDNIKEGLNVPNYSRQRVHLKLPKFKIETKVDFNEILKKLGIVKIFQDSAELPKLTGEPLKVSAVVQKALIEVEEEGTTAAAATAVQVSLTRSGHVQRERKEFIANHPFIFYLKYQSVVLFIGHYVGK